MVSLYYRDASASIICFDLTDERSFTSTHYWISEMQKNSPGSEFVMALAGNKCDVDPSKKTVSKEMGDELC